MWSRTFTLWLVSVSVLAAERDPDTGLVMSGDWEVVKAQCIACHSTALITQHRLSRAGWQASIRYMQKNHNLWDLGEFESPILDYLETNYGPGTTMRSRRKNLPYFETGLD